ncbi:MAG: hypothetical protein ACRD15_06355 [Vicinamibacterales bacterium]
MNGKTGEPVNWDAADLQVTSNASVSERLLSVIILTVFWAAFMCLACGLALWLFLPADALGERFLRAGLIGLFILPILRLALAIAAAARARDAILFVATLAVITILLALTLRDAVTHNVLRAG